jgi:YesN/AraC family two-component response regulator
MTYKVFLVEDEIVTREGIRDSVDWASAGYQFCGEAPDGEIVLPMIQERKPETVITDIKMPFMDGLQLCRTLRETLPETKIIILSGHDEFKYAQEAIQIGVTEYLLKPIVPQDLLAALRKVAQQIDQERQASAHLQALQAQMADMIAHSFAQALPEASPGHVQAPDEAPASPSHDHQAHSHSALIAKARAYIDAHYADTDISLSSVAAHVLLSPTYFSVVFGREVGETFIEYLTHVRIRKAIGLLRATGLTSSEIAYRVGYHNPRYFYSVFRKVAGLPPNEFRRRTGF